MQHICKTLLSYKEKDCLVNVEMSYRLSVSILKGDMSSFKVQLYISDKLSTI